MVFEIDGSSAGHARAVAIADRLLLRLRLVPRVLRLAGWPFWCQCLGVKALCRGLESYNTGAVMDGAKRIHDVTIKCPHCGQRFPSPIFIRNTAAFESAILSNNATNCPNPKCGKDIDCNKENMSYTLADEVGGFVGYDFPGNKGA
ncbi:MAG: hypothetical protein ACMG51_09400 [Ginsengibacter sp.]